MNFCLKSIALFAISMFLFACDPITPLSDIGSGNNDTLRIATYNVRIRTTADKGNLSWSKRRGQVAQLIADNNFHIAGLQELIDQDQEYDLKQYLPFYNFYSRGRNSNAGTIGERLAIIYKKDRFTLLNSGYFFLSETPDVVSKGWDAQSNRMCIWLQISDNITHKTFFVCNTHFDNVGVTARIKSAELLKSRIQQLAAGFPVICLGDFNSSPFETPVYQTMTSFLSDSKTICTSQPTGFNGTFNNWEMSSTNFDEVSRFDYIYTSGSQVQSYKVISDKYATENYPSDHFPVFVTLKLLH